MPLTDEEENQIFAQLPRVRMRCGDCMRMSTKIKAAWLPTGFAISTPLGWAMFEVEVGSYRLLCPICAQDHRQAVADA